MTQARKHSRQQFSNISRTILNRSSGFSLLEQAAVFPVLLLFIFGTIDVTNLLRAFSAMQQGAKTSLRCVSPTDALCTKAPNTPVGLYEVSRTAADPIYYGYNFTYSGQSSALEGPNYNWNNPTASVLTNANVPVQGYTGQSALFNARASIGYNARIATFPEIVGADPRNPSFKLADKKTDYPDPLQFDGVTLSLPVAPRVPDSSDATIIVPKPNMNASLPCVTVVRPMKPVSLSNIDVTQRCETSWDWDNQDPKQPHFISLKGKNELSDQTYVVIHALGSATVASDSIGKVALTLNWSTKNGKGQVVHHSRDLGGGLLAPGNNQRANFYPRGAPLADIDSRISDHPEFTIHQAIPIIYGTKYKLNFRLLRLAGTGPIRWDGGKVNVYLPYYKSRTDETLGCQSSLTNPQIQSNQGCVTSPLALDQDFIMNLTNTGQSAQSVPVHGCYVSQPDAQASLQSDAPVLDSSVSCPAALRVNCPSNFGVSDITSASAFDACPVNSHGITRDNFMSFGVTWDEAAKPLAPVSAARENCQDQIPDINAVYGDYQKLSPGPLSITYSDIVLTDKDGLQIDPAISKQSNLYSCSDFPVWSEAYNSAMPSIPTTSLFKGERPDLGCSWQQALNDEAVALRNQEHPLAYFKADRALISGSRYQLAGAPGDSCITYTSAFGTDTQTVKLGTFEAGKFPPECNLDGSQCSAKFVGFSAQQQDNLLDSERASKLGMGEIQAAFPSAATCPAGNANCANISVAADQNDPSMVVANADITVPISLLFNHPVTLNYTDRQRLESSFSR